MHSLSKPNPLPRWRNWQTQGTQNPPPQGVSVRVRPWAPWKINRDSRLFFCLSFGRTLLPLSESPSILQVTSREKISFYHSVSLPAQIHSQSVFHDTHAITHAINRFTCPSTLSCFKFIHKIASQTPCPIVTPTYLTQIKSLFLFTTHQSHPSFLIFLQKFVDTEYLC